MSILTFTEYRNKAANPYNTVQITKNTLATASNLLSSLWTAAPFNGSAPGAAAVPTHDTVGAMPDWRDCPNTLRVARAQFDQLNTNATRGVLLLCDRLSHQSGLNSTLATVQTTNLPTAALTRYTDGIGVQVGFEIYSILGTTGRTITATYTNQDGTSGRVSPVVPIGATSYREVGRFIPMPLQTGDKGVQSVQSVQFNASTGTAGNVGVTLYKPLAMFPLTIMASSRDQLLAGNLVDVHPDACLFWLFIASGATALGNWQATVSFIEDDV